MRPRPGDSRYELLLSFEIQMGDGRPHPELVREIFAEMVARVESDYQVTATMSAKVRKVRFEGVR